MAKHPCGTCSIEVKYKAVSCNSCKRWYHVECVNMSNEKFKQLCKTQPHTWTCEKYCVNSNTPSKPSSNMVPENLSHNKKMAEDGEKNFSTSNALKNSTPSKRKSQGGTSISSTPRDLGKTYHALSNKELNLSSSFQGLEESTIQTDSQISQEVSGKSNLALLDENALLRKKKYRASN